MYEATEKTIAMGLRIQHSRKAAKLTQMQFSERIGVSPQYISDLERGLVGCSVSTLIKMCDVLEVSADFILRGQEPDNLARMCPPEQYRTFSPEEQKLLREGFELLTKAFSVNSRNHKRTGK